MSDQPEFLGKQLILDLFGCPSEKLDDLATVEQALKACAEAINATIVSISFHKFSPQGVSGVVVIMESHIAIHTWPEHGYAAVDMFTCGDMDMHQGAVVVKSLLGATRTEEREVRRGGRG